MKIYLTVDITKGWDTWNKIAEEPNSDMVSVGGMEFIFKDCETDEKEINLIMEVESMENHMNG